MILCEHSWKLTHGDFYGFLAFSKLATERRVQVEQITQRFKLALRARRHSQTEDRESMKRKQAKAYQTFLHAIELIAGSCGTWTCVCQDDADESLAAESSADMEDEIERMTEGTCRKQQKLQPIQSLSRDFRASVLSQSWQNIGKNNENHGHMQHVCIYNYIIHIYIYMCVYYVTYAFQNTFSFLNISWNYWYINPVVFLWKPKPVGVSKQSWTSTLWATLAGQKFEKHHAKWKHKLPKWLNHMDTFVTEKLGL